VNIVNILDGYLGIRLPNQTMTCRAYLCPFADILYHDCYSRSF